eukprot:TRINITY_DN35026_c0_g1_i1.p2 TRINITY_DN35026_c0_g1~~TRINITY_DN35026_c0_g1_i1.p2  ORF type:complete len:148 (+),score=10.00 TRINITY_DN35026_c0_g1_i1:233-676(+)
MQKLVGGSEDGLYNQVRINVIFAAERHRCDSPRSSEKVLKCFGLPSACVAFVIGMAVLHAWHVLRCAAEFLQFIEYVVPNPYLAGDSKPVEDRERDLANTLKAEGAAFAERPLFFEFAENSLLIANALTLFETLPLVVTKRDHPFVN